MNNKKDFKTFTHDGISIENSGTNKLKELNDKLDEITKYFNKNYFTGASIRLMHDRAALPTHSSRAHEVEVIEDCDVYLEFYVPAGGTGHLKIFQEFKGGSRGQSLNNSKLEYRLVAMSKLHELESELKKFATKYNNPIDVALEEANKFLKTEKPDPLGMMKCERDVWHGAYIDLKNHVDKLLFSIKQSRSKEDYELLEFTRALSGIDAILNLTEVNNVKSPTK